MSGQKFNFEVELEKGKKPRNVLLLGIFNPGMAGLTTTDYLVRQIESEKIGHISSPDFAGIAPFEKGQPRHHTRLYNTKKLSVLVNELYIPPGVSTSYVDTLLEWSKNNNIEEICILHGIPFPHGPEEHKIFHVSTGGYKQKHLKDKDIEGLSGGFLDGVVGDLLIRNLEGKAPPIGIYITPTHPPGPDIEASMRFLDTIKNIYKVDIDKKELENIAEKLKQYYSNLAERLEELKQQETVRGTRQPIDRSYI